MPTVLVLSSLLEHSYALMQWIQSHNIVKSVNYKIAIFIRNFSELVRGQREGHTYPLSFAVIVPLILLTFIMLVPFKFSQFSLIIIQE